MNAQQNETTVVGNTCATDENKNVAPVVSQIALVRRLSHACSFGVKAYLDDRRLSYTSLPMGYCLRAK